MSSPVISYFAVQQPLYEVAETNEVPGGNNLPTIVPISGTLTLTPCSATGAPFPEDDSSALNATLMIDPISGRFNTSMDAKPYTVQTGDTWASIVAAFGGLGLTVASLQAENPSVTTLTAGTVITIPSVPDGALRADNGTLGLQLVDNVNLGLPEGGLVYRGDYSNVVFDQISGRHINSLYFAAPGNGATINLNTVTRLDLF